MNLSDSEASHSRLNSFPLAVIAFRHPTVVSTLTGDFHCPDYTSLAVLDLRCLIDYRVFIVNYNLLSWAG